MREAYRQLELEAAVRASGLEQLTRVIAHRDARIADLERIAEERLTALEKTTVAHISLRTEADKRAAGELVAIARHGSPRVG